MKPIASIPAFIAPVLRALVTQELWYQGVPLLGATTGPDTIPELRNCKPMYVLEIAKPKPQ
jgi:hypothetical protein